MYRSISEWNYYYYHIHTIYVSLCHPIVFWLHFGPTFWLSAHGFFVANIKRQLGLPDHWIPSARGTEKLNWKSKQYRTTNIQILWHMQLLQIYLHKDDLRWYTCIIYLYIYIYMFCKLYSCKWPQITQWGVTWYDQPSPCTPRSAPPLPGRTEKASSRRCKGMGQVFSELTKCSQKFQALWSRNGSVLKPVSTHWTLSTCCQRMLAW